MLNICAANLDALKFQDAFNAARNEAGAAGIFFWRGEPYHTATAEEKAACSPEEWAAFEAAIRDSLDSYCSGLAPDATDLLAPEPLEGPGAEPVLFEIWSSEPAESQSSDWGDLFQGLFD